MKFKTLQELFADEGRWCQGAFARDANGDHVSLSSADAAKWSLAGAVMAVYPNVGDRCRVFTKLDFYLDGKCSEDFNDHPSTTIADIRRVCELAGV